MGDPVNLRTVGFWRPKPPSFDTLLADAIGVAQGRAPVRSFAQTMGAVLNGGLPWPGDYVDRSWDPRERDVVITYLRHKGFRDQAYKGHAECRLCDRKDNGCADFTDQTWLWPEGYAHYLEAHAVRSPPEFVAHVRAELQRLAAALPR